MRFLPGTTLCCSSQNLMDYIFSLLENNASALEQEVQERTQELVMEKQKSDVLLNRMLPRYKQRNVNPTESFPGLWRTG